MILKALYMAFLGTLGLIFWGSHKNPKDYIPKKSLFNSIKTPSSTQKSY